MEEKLLVTPRIDAIFKAIFARNIDLLQDFLSAVMEVDGDFFTDIKVLNPELLPEAYSDKFARLDLLVETVTGEKINVEMQNHDENNYKERSVFNCSKLFTDGFKAGKDYKALLKTICINVLQFNLFESDGYKSTVYPIIKETGEAVTDKWQIHYFETKKLPEVAATRLERWLRFFTIDTKEELEMVKSQGDSMINKAADVTLSMNADDRMREVARVRLDSWLNESIARHKLIQETEERASRQRSFAIAKNLLSLNIPLSHISQATDLSLADIQNLQAGLSI
jgi:predicted transposase/invertase (TIGR01784 family)